MLSPAIGQSLLKLARESILAGFGHAKPELPDAPGLNEKRGVFVTLHKHGELRGCIGYIRGYKSVAQSVSEMAQSAAFHDPRFAPVKESELRDIQIEISVLSELIPVAETSEIEIGRDGLLLDHPHGSGVFLPQVPVEWNWDLPNYLTQLCRKAGVHNRAWEDREARLYRFWAEVFAETDFLP